MKKTQIVLYDLILQEPVTAFTDFIITILCLWFLFSLSKTKTKTLSNKNWQYFFLSVAISTFLGGISHLFYHYLQGYPYKTTWLGMNIASSISVFFAELTAIEILFRKNKVLLTNLSLLLLITFISFSLVLQNFLIAKINMAIGLIFILITYLITNIRGIKGSLFIVYGISLSFITIAIHSFQWSLHKWFNFNDISHLFMIFSLYLMFKGASTFNQQIPDIKIA
jgi:hypothetical protein